MSGSADLFGLSVPVLKHLGVVAEMAEGGRSHISLELRPELLDSFDASHGGVIMIMLDVAMAVSARSRILSEGKAPPGGKSLWFCEG